MELEHRKEDLEEILKAATERYGVASDELSFIGGFQNRVYEFKKNNKFYILRLTDSSHRSEENIIGELDWILYLAEREVPLSRPVLSNEGRLTERIVYKDIDMTAVVFDKAPGKKLIYPEYLSNAAIFEQLGAITGRLHKASKNYRAKSESSKRHQWFDNYYLKKVPQFIPEEQTDIHKAYELLRNQLMSLNHDSEGYGLIHGDINVGNFCVEEDRITLFDFDECQYSWFVEDIAIQLFYTVYVILDDSPKERKEMADLFMTHFMKGYLSENHLEKYWLEQVPIFLKLRELIVHVGIYRSWNFKDLNQWQKDYLEQSDGRIKNGVPIEGFNEEWCRVM